MVRQNTTGTGFVPGRVTSEAPVTVGLCVLTSGASRQAERLHGFIQHGLQSVLQVYRGTNKDRVTLIQLGDDQCQQGVLRERPSHATNLAQCCKIRSDGVEDLGPHDDAGVDVDTKIRLAGSFMTQSFNEIALFVLPQSCTQSE